MINRHPSATALLFEGKTLLFDCGEGTIQRLIEADISRATIESIFISHFHCDHVLGLFGLISVFRSDFRKKPLEIFAPVGIVEFIKSTLKWMDVVPTFELIIKELPTNFAGEILRTNEYSVQTAMLEHRIDSFGFRVETIPHVNIDIQKVRNLGMNDFRKIGEIKRGNSVRLPDGKVITLEKILAPQKKTVIFVYCGDTRPCLNTIELAQGADVLLHEATFESNFVEKAMERFHTTSTEAAQIAKDAKVRRLVMTHLSTRYKDGRVLLHEAREIFKESYLAKELLISNI